MTQKICAIKTQPDKTKESLWKTSHSKRAQYTQQLNHNEQEQWALTEQYDTQLSIYTLEKSKDGLLLKYTFLSWKSYSKDPPPFYIWCNKI